MVNVRIRLTPRGGEDRIEGAEHGELRCRVAAPPAGGAANAALIRLIAVELDLPRSAIQLVAGAKARRKVLGVPEAARATIARRWPGLLD